MNRRRLLLLGAQALVAGPALAEAGEGNAGGYGLLVDTTRCVGCQACEVACADAHGLPRPAVSPTSDPPARGAERGLCPSTATALTVVQRLEVRDHGTVWAKKSCLHCLEPACAAACPEEALTASDSGAVLHHAERCVRCRRCAHACPFDAIRFAEETGVVSKCDLCHERLQQGQPPACAQVCPQGAVSFARRDALLEAARARFAAAPGRYLDRIFGRRELGGTSVLLIAGTPFGQLSLPAGLGASPATVPGGGSGLLRSLPWAAGAALAPLLLLHALRSRGREEGA